MASCAIYKENKSDLVHIKLKLIFLTSITSAECAPVETFSLINLLSTYPHKSNYIIEKFRQALYI